MWLLPLERKFSFKHKYAAVLPWQKLNCGEKLSLPTFNTHWQRWKIAVVIKLARHRAHSAFQIGLIARKDDSSFRHPFKDIPKIGAFRARRKSHQMAHQ